MGDFETARVETKKAVDLRPNVAGLRIVYARILLTIGMFDQAYREILHSIRLQPNVFPFTLLILAVICLMTGRYQQAVAALSKHEELAYTNASGALMLAASYNALNEKEHAQLMLDQAMDIDPSLTIRDAVMPYPFKDPTHHDMLVQLLRDANVPE